MSSAVLRGGRAGRSRHLVRAATISVALVSAGALAGCGTTVVETTDSTLSAGETTTTVPLPATTTGRIEQIVTLARGLGDLIVDGGDREVIARIDALWAASSAEVGSDDPDLGRVRVQAPVVQMSDTPGRVEHLGRPLGADNDAVYGDLLGLAPDRLDQLRAERVI